MQLQMNGPLWVGWLVLAMLALISVVLLLGKGSWLIAGYNTSTKEEKRKYNEKRLCRIVGGGMGVLTIQFGLVLLFNGNIPKAILWMYPYGIVGTVVLVLILANTVGKKKK